MPPPAGYPPRPASIRRKAAARRRLAANKSRSQAAHRPPRGCGQQVLPRCGGQARRDSAAPRQSQGGGPVPLRRRPGASRRRRRPPARAPGRCGPQRRQTPRSPPAAPVQTAQLRAHGSQTGWCARPPPRRPRRRPGNIGSAGADRLRQTGGFRPAPAGSPGSRCRCAEFPVRLCVGSSQYRPFRSSKWVGLPSARPPSKIHCACQAISSSSETRG